MHVLCGNRGRLATTNVRSQQWSFGRLSDHEYTASAQARPIYAFAKPRTSACKMSVDTASHNAPVRLHASGGTFWMVNATLFIVMQLTHMPTDFSEPMPFTNRTVLRKSPSEFDNTSSNIRHFCGRHFSRRMLF